MSNPSGIDIQFDGGAVGVIDPDLLPDAGGILGYEPYRSGSHYALQQAIKAGDKPSCTFLRDGVEYSFIVESCPDYGELRIRDIRRI